MYKPAIPSTTITHPPLLYLIHPLLHLCSYPHEFLSYASPSHLPCLPIPTLHSPISPTPPTHLTPCPPPTHLPHCPPQPHSSHATHPQSQYIYIHDAINDYINCKDTTIVAHELRPRIEEMRQIDSTTGSSGFVTQFSVSRHWPLEPLEIVEYAQVKSDKYPHLCITPLTSCSHVLKVLYSGMHALSCLLWND